MIKPDILAHSSNFTIRQPSGKAVVIHATRSGVSMNPNEFQGTLNWFKRADVGLSSHWVISRTGVTARVVNDDCLAVHAGEHNATHWGIELEQGVEADGFTGPQIDALVAVCKGYVADFGVPPIHISTGTAPGFIGHEETPQGRRVGKSDPGAGFPWVGFINALSAPVAPPTALPTVGEVAHATHYLYAAYFEKDKGRLHPFDAGVIERALAWWKAV